MLSRYSRLILCLTLVASSVTAQHRAPDPLLQCAKKMLLHEGQSLQINYDESLHILYHSFEPWQTLSYTINGAGYFANTAFAQHDTLTSGKRVRYSTRQFTNSTLGLRDYGDTALSSVSKAGYSTELIESSTHWPGLLLRYFKDHRNQCEVKQSPDHTGYTLRVGENIVTLNVRISDALLESTTVLSNDELLGDVLAEYTYKDYQVVGNVALPRRTLLSRTNGKLFDTARVLSAKLENKSIPTLIVPDTNFHFADEIEEQPNVTVEKFDSHLTFINLNHIAARALVVEFPDYLVVSTAPLTSKNGELIVDEVHKSFPGKKIKYFVVGHSCPWSLGGVRAFIRESATVLCRKNTVPYVEYIAAAPHSIKPDRLQTNPSELTTEDIGDSLTLSDGDWQMKMYCIGAKSGHTSDYMIYYFPQEKSVWNDDLAFIPEDGKVTKAGKRQAGLYQAITDLHLSVDTVLQSWPLTGYKVRTTFPFSELEASVKLQ